MKIILAGFWKITIFAGLMMISLEGQSTEQPSGSSRDLTKYDHGGPFEVDFSKDRSERLSRIRAFLWTHWTEKQLGWLRAKYFSKEGALTAANYYVEPDSHGIWRIHVRLEKGTKGNPSLNEYSIYRLKKTGSKEKGTERLIFQDANGGKITDF